MTRSRFPTLPALLAGVTLLGCVAPEPPAPPDLARRFVPPPPPAPPPPPPPPPRMAEVEINGKVLRPKSVKGEITVWATNGPCFQEGTAAYGSTTTNPESFFLEIFVPQGSKIWLCAANSDGKDALAWTGQSDGSPVLGAGAGEVTPKVQTIPLKKGRKVTPPAPTRH